MLNYPLSLTENTTFIKKSFEIVSNLNLRLLLLPELHSLFEVLKANTQLWQCIECFAVTFVEVLV